MTLRGSDCPSADRDMTLRGSDCPFVDHDSILDDIKDKSTLRGSDCPSDHDASPVPSRGSASSLTSTSRPPKKARLKKTQPKTALRLQYRRQLPTCTIPDVDAYVCTLAHSTNATIPPPHEDILLDPALIFHAQTSPDSVSPSIPHPTTNAYTTIDSKAGTLTQSQMLKLPDMANFIKAQLLELQGLLKMDVLDLLPIAQKPSHARLLSSI
jgi:hypothetical protein